MTTTNEMKPAASAETSDGGRCAVDALLAVEATYTEGTHEKTLDDIIGALPQNHLARLQLAGIRANLAKRGKSDGTGPNLDPWIQVAKLRGICAKLKHELSSANTSDQPPARG